MGKLLIFEKIKSIKSTKQELVKFGIILGILFVIIGLILLCRGKSYAKYILILSGLFFFLGLVIPISLKKLYKLWIITAIILEFFMTRFILIIFFYLIITPIGILGRLFGMKFLDLKIKKNAESYWTNKEEKEFKKDNYERQF